MGPFHSGDPEVGSTCPEHFCLAKKEKRNRGVQNALWKNKTAPFNPGLGGSEQAEARVVLRSWFSDANETR